MNMDSGNRRSYVSAWYPAGAGSSGCGGGDCGEPGGLACALDSSGMLNSYPPTRPSLRDLHYYHPTIFQWGVSYSAHSSNSEPRDG